jgi:PKD repeat protein
MSESAVRWYVLLAVICQASLALAQAPEQDCFNSILICSPTYNQSNSYSGIGTVNDVAPGQTCLGNGEVNSVWYSITVTQDGTFGFQLTPNNPTDDYDFAVFNLTGDSCSSIASGSLAPISCNYSATTGATGLSNAGSQSNVGTSGPNQCSVLNVTAGETYMIMVSNFTASQAGYTLDITGSGSILDNIDPEIINVNLNGSCNPNRLYLELSEQVLCSTLDGTEFTITGPTGVVINSATAINCTQEGLTSQIRLNLQQPITTLGTYTVHVNNGADGNTLEDRCGNQITNGFTIQFEIEFIGPTVTVNTVTPTDCGQANGSINISVSGGTQPYTYNWNSNPVQTTQDANGLEAGNYRIRVTDANGCEFQQSINVSSNGGAQVAPGAVTPVSCFGGSDGAAQVLPSGGNAPYAYSWNTNPPQFGQTAFNLAAGNYVCTVTDASNCETMRSMSVPQPTQVITANVNVEPSCGQNDGSITMNASGGTPGYSYFWNTTPPQNGATANNLGAGVYNVNVSDANGCLTQVMVTLNNVTAPNASVTESLPDCGQNSGSATVQATSGAAPLTYVWNTNPAQFGTTATGLAVGDYYVTITDANGCVQTINVKIDITSPPDLTLVVTDSDCGMNNGAIDGTVALGTAPYSYTWSHDGTLNVNSVTGLPPGQYTLVVTDDLGCTDQETVTVVQLPPTSSFTATTVCETFATDFVATTTSMATDFVWDFGDGTSGSGQITSHTYAAPGNYVVTVSMTGGCQDDQASQSGVTVNPLPDPNFTHDPDVPTTRTPVTFVYTGTPVTTYQWSIAGHGSSADQNFTTVIPTEGLQTVQLTVTDANGCSDQISQDVMVLLEPGLYMPNTFRVGSANGANQRFVFFGTGIVEGELSIHDRWGKQHYFSSDVNELTNVGWGGTSLEGTLLPEDSYSYRVRAKFYNGREFNAVGTITLMH